MGWSIGFDPKWNRDIGYGVPAVCDHPGCNKEIDRGLSYVCGQEPYGGDQGCGLYFCSSHLFYDSPDPEWSESPPSHAEEEEYYADEPEGTFVCERCRDESQPFEPKPDVQEWLDHKATDPSWAEWRATQT